ncbi:MAG: hypothetical protein JWN14_4251 [Chthonomonadales bacterium]|nr:hypothetical protein [Chthonomonadales bacterium]
MTRDRRRAALFIFLLLTSIVVCASLWLRAERHQYALDRQLIAALVRSDDQQALVLVKSGADPNTPCHPVSPPSLRQLWNHLLSHSPLPTTGSPTALSIACGAWYEDNNIYRWSVISDAPLLIEAMLRHGADPNAKDQDGWTPLSWAIRENDQKTVSVLLDYGADVTRDASPLTTAVSTSHVEPFMLLLLIKHGADVNTRDSNGDTPLILALASDVPLATIRLLLEHGANPTLIGVNGRTSL